MDGDPTADRFGVEVVGAAERSLDAAARVFRLAGPRISRISIEPESTMTSRSTGRADLVRPLPAFTRHAPSHPADLDTARNPPHVDRLGLVDVDPPAGVGDRHSAEATLQLEAARSVPTTTSVPSGTRASTRPSVASMRMRVGSADRPIDPAGIDPHVGSLLGHHGHPPAVRADADDRPTRHLDRLPPLGHEATVTSDPPSGRRSGVTPGSCGG